MGSRAGTFYQLRPTEQAAHLKCFLNMENIEIRVRTLFQKLIIYMKKLLDSDWLRAVQFKCNTSAKSVTPVQKV